MCCIAARGMHVRVHLVYAGLYHRSNELGSYCRVSHSFLWVVRVCVGAIGEVFLGFRLLCMQWHDHYHFAASVQLTYFFAGFYSFIVQLHIIMVGGSGGGEGTEASWRSYKCQICKKKPKVWCDQRPHCQNSLKREVWLLSCILWGKSYGKCAVNCGSSIILQGFLTVSVESAHYYWVEWCSWWEVLSLHFQRITRNTCINMSCGRMLLSFVFSPGCSSLAGL
jgi:hypothetical protein